MIDSIRVAIAEDSGVLRDGLVQLLADRGFVITAAVGEAEGLRAAVAEDCPDVAVIDIRMPPTFTDEGLQAAIDLRRQHAGDDRRSDIIVLLQHCIHAMRRRGHRAAAIACGQIGGAHRAFSRSSE